jgi:hypothetical protein
MLSKLVRQGVSIPENVLLVQAVVQPPAANPSPPLSAASQASLLLAGW